MSHRVVQIQPGAPAPRAHLVLSQSWICSECQHVHTEYSHCPGPICGGGMAMYFPGLRQNLYSHLLLHQLKAVNTPAPQFFHVVNYVGEHRCQQPQI